MRHCIPKNAICKKAEVEDSARKAVISHNESATLNSSLPSNVFLTGMRACGKTSLGRILADNFKMNFVDTDHLFVQETGGDIASWVKDHGWESFRDREEEILKRVCAQQGQVVATGGGVVLRESNRTLMKKSGVVFYMMADVPTLLARLEQNEDPALRPRFSDADLREELAATLRERESLYTESMHAILRSDASFEEQVASVEDGLAYIPF